VEQMKNDNLELRHQADIYKLHIRNRTIAMSIFIVSAIFMLVILIIIIRKRRSDKKKNAFIQQQKDKIMEFERNKFIREKAEMDANINEKNRELTSYVLDISAINKFHETISERLKKLNDSDSQSKEDMKKEINMIILDLKHRSETQLGDDFRKYFNEVSPRFFVLLASKHPDLTEGERRLCAFLFLGLTSKEIASITFHDIHSVEKNRQRLRKKLGLEPQASISNYLRSFYYYKEKEENEEES
jgi:DNA-binding CsgD family transcriptional regulator